MDDTKSFIQLPSSSPFVSQETDNILLKELENSKYGFVILEYNSVGDVDIDNFKIKLEAEAKCIFLNYPRFCSLFTNSVPKLGKFSNWLTSRDEWEKNLLRHGHPVTLPGSNSCIGTERYNLYY